MLKIIQKINRISKNQPTYSAYPTYKKQPSGNVDTISVDTTERAIRLVDKKTTNKSFGFSL